VLATPTAEERPATPLTGLRIADLSKDFPGTRALDGVTFEVGGGRICALLGGNGSGKSTLIKILAGVVTGNPGGHVEVRGASEASDRITPEWARAVGLAFVHQDLGLFDTMTVAENVFVGLPYPRRLRGVDWPAMRRQAQEALDRLDIAVDARRPLGALRPSERTLVAIARALRGRERFHEGVLVLDEPTARLPGAEADHLLAALRRYADAGQAALYVSHRLEEVLEVADDVAVLRDGRLVERRPRAGLDAPELVSLIVGQRIAGKPARRVAQRPADRAALEVEDLSAGVVQEVSLTVAPGEIVGVAGLVGSGRTTLLEAVAGVRRPGRGRVRLAGEELRAGDVRAAVAAGMVYVPEDRPREGAFLGLSVAQNISAGAPQRYWRRLRFRHGEERRDAVHAVERFSIRASAVTAPLQTLSGGNQQKTVLARWLGVHPRMLLLDEPTQGVDVGARADIYEYLDAATKDGVGILLVSSDFEELLTLADRVLALSRGRVVDERARADVTREWLEERVHFSLERSAPA
jgi:ABC-type sugar transport system ATPase subunit